MRALKRKYSPGMSSLLRWSSRFAVSSPSTTVTQSGSPSGSLRKMSNFASIYASLSNFTKFKGREGKIGSRPAKIGILLYFRNIELTDPFSDRTSTCRKFGE